MALDCRSETGKTVGLIDSLITIAHVLSERDLSASEIEEALKDLGSTSELDRLMTLGRQLQNKVPPEKAIGVLAESSRIACPICGSEMQLENEFWVCPSSNCQYRQSENFLDDFMRGPLCHKCKAQMFPDQQLVNWCCPACGARDSMRKY